MNPIGNKTPLEALNEIENKLKDQRSSSNKITTVSIRIEDEKEFLPSYELNRLKVKLLESEGQLSKMLRLFFNSLGISIGIQETLDKIKRLKEVTPSLEADVKLEPALEEKSENEDPIKRLENEIIAFEKKIQNYGNLAKEEKENFEPTFEKISESVLDLTNQYHSDHPQKDALIVLFGEFKVTQALIFSLMDISPQKAIIPFAGVQNGGACCYLSSAIQIISAVDEFKDLLHKDLTKRENEDANVFEIRKLIRDSLKEIISNINLEKEINRDEINTFRKLCYENHILKGIENEYSIGAAPETLESLLELMDYQIPLIATETSYARVEEADELNAKTAINPPEKLVLGIGEESNMQDLLTQKSMVEGRRFKDKNGKDSVGNFNTTTTISSNQQFPKTLQITVAQTENNKKRILEPQTIILGNTWYQLKAVIEHRPGHYVAHRVIANDDIVEVNDDWLHRTINAFDIPGEVYFYERIDDKESSQ